MSKHNKAKLPWWRQSPVTRQEAVWIGWAPGRVSPSGHNSYHLLLCIDWIHWLLLHNPEKDEMQMRMRAGYFNKHRNVWEKKTHLSDKLTFSGIAFPFSLAVGLKILGSWHTALGLTNSHWWENKDTSSSDKNNLTDISPTF